MSVRSRVASARRAAIVIIASLAVAVVVVAAPPSDAQSASTAPTQTPPATPVAFTLGDASVTPRRAYVAGRPVVVTFTVQARTPLDLQVDVVGEKTGQPVRRLAAALAATPGVAQRLRWDGLTGGGRVAPDGRYRVRIRGSDGGARNVGRLTLHSHAYPIRGEHADRGPIGAFGVGRDGGRTHEGFDVDSPCGTPVVATRGGRVVRATYDPVLYGNLVIVRGAHTKRDYWYAHLLRTTRLRTGDTVLTGERIGSIGATGNARTIGCHLHFELHARGVPIDPEPELHAWDAWS